MTTDTRPTLLSTAGCRTRAEVQQRINEWRSEYVADNLRRAGASMIAADWPTDRIAENLSALRVELEAAAANVAALFGAFPRRL